MPDSAQLLPPTGAPGYWRAQAQPAAFHPAGLSALSHRFREPCWIVTDRQGRIGIGLQGVPCQQPGADTLAVAGWLPALYPEWLGERSFNQTHGTRFPYIAGAMANGIATTGMVSALAQAGCLGFFGAAGLSLARVEIGIGELKSRLGATALPWGSNLIHSPAEPALEDAVADLYLQHEVRLVEASAFMALTPAVVRYAATGLTRDPDGRIRRRNRVIAKVSREEVARHFLAPAPAALLEELVQRGQLNRSEAELAARIPIAEDLTVEADSGGHTDRRPLSALLPAISRLRDQLSIEHGYAVWPRVGAAGGLGTPAAVAAAFALGAAYVQTGSVNQACVESGLASSAREMLAQAELTDVIMAPAADMFELGVEVQVLRRGSLFAVRARKLYELYRKYDALEQIPATERLKLEQQILRNSIDEAWASTRAFWLSRDPAQVERAEAEPRHRMALVFRSYLGLASRWAIDGLDERRADFQIWCGPAMGAFNQWARGSFLELPANRSVVQVARNLLEGAAVIARAQQLRSFGVAIPAQAFDFRPRWLE